MEALNALQPSLLVIGSAGLCNDTVRMCRQSGRHAAVCLDVRQPLCLCAYGKGHDFCYAHHN
jgi:hypothetical protein